MEKDPKENKTESHDGEEIKSSSQTARTILKEAIDGHYQKQLRMYNAFNFYKGRHYESVQTSTGKTVSTSTGVTVNRIKPIVDRRVNNIIKLRPIWDVEPLDDSDVSLKKASETSDYLNFVFRTQSLKAKTRQVIKHGIVLYSGWLWFDYDKELNGGKGGVRISLENPFYIFTDIQATSPEDWRYLVRIVKRQVQDVRNDEYYDEQVRQKVKPQMKLGATPIFQRVVDSERKDTQMPATDKDEQIGSCFIAEVYTKTYVECEVEEADEEGEEERDKKKKKKTKTHLVKRIRKVCLDVAAPDNVLSNKITDLEDFPPEGYFSQTDMLSTDGENQVDQLIPLNKGYNRIKTLQVVAAERAGTVFTLPQGTRVDIDRLSDGSKVYRVDGKIVKNLPKTENSSVPQYTELSNGFQVDLEDLSGDRSSNIFRGDRSGAAIDSLIDLDNENFIEDKENLTDFYGRVANKILWYTAKYQGKVGSFVTKDGENIKVTKYVGKESNAAKDDVKDKDYVGGEKVPNLKVEDTKDASPNDLLIIGPENRVEVSIDTELAHTMEAKFDRLGMLMEWKVIDEQQVREELKFTNNAKLAQRMKEREEKRMKLEAEAKAKEAALMAQQGGAPMGQPPAAPQQQVPVNPMQPPTEPGAEAGMDVEGIALAQELQALAQQGKLPPEMASAIAAQGMTMPAQ